jgi:hypothetical protein
VSGCQFVTCSGAVFARGRNSVISNNIAVNCTDAALVLNDVTAIGCVVANNTISNEALASIPSMIAVEEGPSNWTIIGNTLTGANGGGIVCTNVLGFTVVKGGVIANNVIDGKNSAGKLPGNGNPAALLAITSYYTDCVVHDNIIRNCPSGNSNSRLAIIPATGGSFHDNLIDGSATTGLSAIVEISAGPDGLTIKDNKTTGATGTRHYLFGSGDYHNVPCTFVGGKFYGGTEGINCEFKSAEMANLTLCIDNVRDCTAKVLINGPTLLGDRARFLNAGAWDRPHRIGVSTEMYCDVLPVHSGRMLFRPGDRFHYLRPDITGYIGVTRTTNGWMSFGAVAKR